MNLRFRLMMLINGLFLAVAVAGALLVIHNAQRAVAEELDSTARLTLQLLELITVHSDRERAVIDPRLLEQLSRLEPTRHLRIELTEAAGAARITRYLGGAEKSPDAPAWFIALVKPQDAAIRRDLGVPEQHPTTLVIRPDPADEITEAWQETRLLLGLVMLFLVTANVVLYVTMGRSLRPVDQVLEGLRRVEQGQYHTRLPSFRLSELQAISDSFNHMASVLERSREEMRQLTKKSLAIQEDERRRLARELHDELGQAISAIKAMAVSISQRDGAEQGARRAADTISEVSDEVYTRVRTMMRRLRPASLDELGLVSALNEMIDDWNRHHEPVTCRFTAEEDFSGLSDDVQIGVYRIIQEGLTNAAKHARAGEVRVKLSISPFEGEPSIALEIRDDGVGLDADSVPKGMGLMGIQERVDALAGTLALDSSPGQGMCLRINIPCLKEEAK